MSTVKKIPIIFEDGDSPERLQEQYGLKLTRTGGANFDEYTIEGDEPEVIKFLVEYNCNVVISGQRRFNLEEFIHWLKDVEPPLEPNSYGWLEDIRALMAEKS